MSDVTRIIRLRPSARRHLANNEGTTCAPVVATRSDVELRFECYQRAMSEAVLAETRPGIMAFVLGPEAIEGSMWLRATDEYRAATIGRHGVTDLFMNQFAGMSLRHCLVLVRRHGEGVRLHVIDLSSSSGMCSEATGPIRAIDSDGQVLLRVAGYVLAFFQTGAGLSWNPECFNPFLSLTPRRVLQTNPAARKRPSLGSRLPDGFTQIVRDAPIDIGTHALCLPEEVPAGRLTLTSGSKLQRLLVGFSALDRGLLLGRYCRCDGNEVLSDHSISRIHAVLVRREGRLLLVDAASTNGIYLDDKAIECEAILSKTRFRLSSSVFGEWEPLD